MRTIWVSLAVFIVVLVAELISSFWQTWLTSLLGQRVMRDLRMEIFSHLQALSISFFDRNPAGRLITRVTSDVDVLNDLFTSGVVTIFGDVFTLLGIMAVMLWMNWRLALVAFAVLPLIALVTQWFRQNVRESYRIVRGWIARIRNHPCCLRPSRTAHGSTEGGDSLTSRGSREWSRPKRRHFPNRAVAVPAINRMRRRTTSSRSSTAFCDRRGEERRDRLPGLG